MRHVFWEKKFFNILKRNYAYLSRIDEKCGSCVYSSDCTAETVSRTKKMHEISFKNYKLFYFLVIFKYTFILNIFFIVYNF